MCIYNTLKRRKSLPPSPHTTERGWEKGDWGKQVKGKSKHWSIRGESSVTGRSIYWMKKRGCVCIAGGWHQPLCTLIFKQSLSLRYDIILCACTPERGIFLLLFHNKYKRREREVNNIERKEEVRKEKAALWVGGLKTLKEREKKRAYSN